LTVEWYNVRLHVHENATDKPFTFQCTLHKDGRIWFAYKQVHVQPYQMNVTSIIIVIIIIINYYYYGGFCQPSSEYRKVFNI